MDVLRTFCGLNEAPSQSCGSLGYPVSAVAAGFGCAGLTVFAVPRRTPCGQRRPRVLESLMAPLVAANGET